MFVPTHLKSLQALAIALKTGSLKGAADILAITPAAVGQRVKALEVYLGVELLVRGRSGLQPAAALAPAVTSLFAGFRELEAVADLLEMQRGQDIHIAAPSDFVELWLQPRLKRFRAANPNIRLCINGEGDAPHRLASADCEISFGSPSENSSGGHVLLFPDFIIPISSPENTRRISKVTRRDRLEGFPLLHLDFYRNDPVVPDWAGWISRHRLRRTAPNRGIRFQRIAAVLEAVRVSAGVAQCGLALIMPAIQDGSVSLPFPRSCGTWTTHTFQARLRAETLLRPQMRRFQDWLREEAQETLRQLKRWVDRGRSKTPP